MNVHWKCAGCGERVATQITKNSPSDAYRDRWRCDCGVWMDGNGRPLIIHTSTARWLHETTAPYLQSLLAEIIINPNKLPGYGQLIINELERRRQQYGEPLT
jgi:hypothetical protein